MKQKPRGIKAQQSEKSVAELQFDHSHLNTFYKIYMYSEFILAKSKVFELVQNISQIALG